jgi:hypothetical protein
MRKYLSILIVLFVSCFNNNKNNRNESSNLEFEEENRQHYEAIRLKPSDISSIEIYENGFDDVTLIKILNQDTIELILKNLINSKNEETPNRMGRLDYTIKLNSINNTEFRYQFWLYENGSAYFNIYAGFAGIAKPSKRNDFFKDFFYGIYKKRI